MTPSDFLTSAIQKELRRVYLCTTQELCALLPQFLPAEITAKIERLIQDGAIASRSSEPSHMILWLPPTVAARRAAHSPIEPGRQNFASVEFEHGSITEVTPSLTQI